MSDNILPVGDKIRVLAKQIAIVGTVGLPANYGGFETLAENLIRVHERRSGAGGDQADLSFLVYCSSRAYDKRIDTFHGARLAYLPIDANGFQSILYDFVSMLSAVRRRSDVILLLGVSGAIALPLIRLIPGIRIVTNIDGIEWRRGKWNGFAKRLLRFLEWCAVRFSHEVIADNRAIADYVQQTYGVNSHVIAYGGDHAIDCDAAPIDDLELPDNYALAIGRVEPENNAAMMLEAFASDSSRSLVAVGNWQRTKYGRSLVRRYAGNPRIRLLEPIYHLGRLKALRAGAQLYVHGHSAGGTNPSLVEAMQFGIPVLAYDCVFNRSSTEERALYFRTSAELRTLLDRADEAKLAQVATDMQAIATRRYTWSAVADQYYALLDKV